MICDTSKETYKKSELSSQQMVNSLRVRSTDIWIDTVHVVKQTRQ